MTPARRLRILEANDRICHICDSPIDPVRDAWDVEHPLAIGLGGTDEDSELRPAHVAPCHKAKTKKDRKYMAKADRVKAKHLGAEAPKSRPMLGSKRSPYRKPMRGLAERRE